MLTNDQGKYGRMKKQWPCWPEGFWGTNGKTKGKDLNDKVFIQGIC